MDNVTGNVCFFHRQSDDKWLWFIADEYGRALIKCAEPFNKIDEARTDFDLHKEELNKRLVISDPFKRFFEP